MDCSPPGSSVLGISQARILAWEVISTPADLPNPGIKLMSPALWVDSLLLSQAGSPKPRVEVNKKKFKAYVTDIYDCPFLGENLQLVMLCSVQGLWSLPVPTERKCNINNHSEMFPATCLSRLPGSANATLCSICFGHLDKPWVHTLGILISEPGFKNRSQSFACLSW